MLSMFMIVHDPLDVYMTPLQCSYIVKLLLNMIVYDPPDVLLSIVIADSAVNMTPPKSALL